ITVPTADDNLVEANETVSVTLLSTNNPKITLGETGRATWRKNDNDSATDSICGTPTVTKGASLTFRVTNSAASSKDTTSNYSLGGIATGGSDLQTTTDSETSPAGCTSAMITVPTTDDTLVEANETVSVTLLSTNNPKITLG